MKGLGKPGKGQVNSQEMDRWCAGWTIPVSCFCAALQADFHVKWKHRLSKLRSDFYICSQQLGEKCPTLPEKQPVIHIVYWLKNDVFVFLKEGYCELLWRNSSVKHLHVEGKRLNEMWGWKNIENKSRKRDVIGVIQFGLRPQITSFHPCSLSPLLHFCSCMKPIASQVRLSFSAPSLCCSALLLIFIQTN